MKKYIVLFFVFLLASCGFYPRGVVGNGNVGNFDSIIGTKFYIENNNYNKFANDLKTALVNYKSQILIDDKDADYIINLKRVQKKSQLTGVVGGVSNNTYQLIYTVSYNIVRPNEKNPVVSDKTLNTQQFWQSNSGTQLAQNIQANRIYNYLQGQLVNNMVNQIAALLPNRDK